ncbi:c-type cytochrome [Teichococcus aestuarii]|uniref:Cytochrome c family protein n=1 Tax=Teichococcus aestuarii TaxID=568898 RepID=A0A2U1V7Y1_9PROT|nr:cytochrome c family protein [Pseudoroseomonas aestuarii]PWC30001.1 cytochrome c family protein [Pseudoroseomonas aestuarii]
MSLEVNKAFAAVLTAGIAFMVAGVVGDVVVHPKRLDKVAIAIEGAPEPGAESAPAAPQVEDVTPLLAAANPEAGQQLAGRLCAACHSFDQGGANKVGPNLYGVVGNHHAHLDNFNYSPALKGLAEKPWDYAALNEFLAGPARAIRGTRMAFAGIRDVKQRADVIAYLRTLSPNPQPLP